MKKARSSALDALLAKEADAREGLMRHFVAFVRAPRGRGLPRAWVFYATNSYLAISETPLFVGFSIGSSAVQTRDAQELIQGLCQWAANNLDEMDVSAPLILASVKGYHRLLLEDAKEPRASSVELLFIDAESVSWCDYAGASGEQGIVGQGAHILIRGCYHKETRHLVSQALGRCRTRPSEASLAAVVQLIRKATGLSQVGYVSIP